jgi:hypothetical protein
MVAFCWFDNKWGWGSWRAYDSVIIILTGVGGVASNSGVLMSAGSAAGKMAGKQERK